MNWEITLSSIALILSGASLGLTLRIRTKVYNLQILKALAETYLSRIRENQALFAVTQSKPGGSGKANPYEAENQQCLDAANRILEYLEDEAPTIPGLKFPGRRDAAHRP